MFETQGPAATLAGHRSLATAGPVSAEGGQNGEACPQVGHVTEF